MYNIDLAGLKTVLVDLDGTIYPFEIASTRARADLAALLSRKIGVSSDKIHQLYNKVSYETEGKILESGLALRRFRLDRLKGELGANFDTMEAASYLGDRLLYHARPFEGAVDAVRSLQLKFNIIIMTEGYSDVQRAIASKMNLGQLPLMASYDTQTRKSDGSAYRELLRRKHLSASEVVMIGDNWRNDIIGAEVCGIRSIWISRDRAMPSAPIAGLLIGYVSNIVAVPIMFRIVDA